MFRAFEDLFDTFFPRLCTGCGSRLSPSEEILCINCDRVLPLSNNYNVCNSDLFRKLCGKIPLKGAASYYIFERQSPVRNLIHQLKYKGNQQIGSYIGKRLGLLLTHPDSIIANVEAVVPLPLHSQKLKSRGYNQCDSFAKSIAETLEVPYIPNALCRAIKNNSQTTMSKHKRFTNVNKIFEVLDESKLLGKHILLVDDVITTGATAESCLATLLEVKNCSVSFASMAEVRSNK